MFSFSQVLVGSAPLKPYGFDKGFKHTIHETRPPPALSLLCERMQALVFSHEEQTLLLHHSYPVPSPGPGEARIKVLRAGICSTVRSPCTSSCTRMHARSPTALLYILQDLEICRGYVCGYKQVRACLTACLPACLMIECNSLLRACAWGCTKALLHACMGPQHTPSDQHRTRRSWGMSLWGWWSAAQAALAGSASV